MEAEQVTIMGTGCAGLTAAIYAARANLKPLVLTGQQPGGLLTTTTVVENFPGFPEGVDGTKLMMDMQAQAERFGARIEYGAIVESVDLRERPFKLIIDGKETRTRTLIIATGSGHRKLGLESERLLENKGVTYCATCDGALPVFRNQPLVVVGGGDSACEEASYLTRFASKVHLVHRRDSLRASKIMADRLLANPKIEKWWDTVVSEIFDVGRGKVTGVRLRNVKTGEEQDLPCAGVFVAIGHAPNTSMLDGQIATDAMGYITPREWVKTNVEGVFVAGDVADPVYRQAVTAAGSGCAAAIEAERYLASIDASIEITSDLYGRLEPAKGPA
jgi:thioredoxin reductase (NADPH)